MCIMFVFFKKDMVGDDEIDVSGPGHGEIFSEKNLVLVYRLALEINVWYEHEPF